MTLNSEPLRHTYVALDGMRGVAALCVMIYHYNEKTGLFMLGKGPAFGAAGLSVDLFFMLSGFVLSHSYAESFSKNLSVQNYLVKRLIRLFPLYFAGLATGLIVHLIIMNTSDKMIDYSEIAKVVSFNTLYFPYPTAEFSQSIGAVIDAEASASQGVLFPFNPPAWSLFFEMIASFCFIYMYRSTPSTLMRMCATFFVLFFLCGVWAMYATDRIGFAGGLGWNNNNFVGGFPRVMFGFTLGILLYKSGRLRALATLRLKDRLGPGAILLSVLLLLSVPFTFRGIYSVFFLLIAAPALVSLGAEVVTRDRFSESVCRGLGWLSYPLYCVHYPVGVLVFFYGDLLGVHREIVFFAAALLSILLSLVLGHLFDVPIRTFFTKRVTVMAGFFSNGPGGPRGL